MRAYKYSANFVEELSNDVSFRQQFGEVKKGIIKPCLLIFSFLCFSLCNEYV
jgi:hypothetical protein